MSIPVSNVATTDLFQIWLNRTNTLLEFMSNQALHANAATGVTTGNAQLSGSFGANVIAAGQLRGGNVSTSGVLAIISDVNIESGDLQIANVVVINSSGGWVTDFVGAANVSGVNLIASANVIGDNLEVSNDITANNIYLDGIINAVSFNVANNFIANSTVANAASFTVGSDVVITNTGIVTVGLTVGTLIFPTTDGTDGQAIVTDGNNNLSFSSLLSWSTLVDSDIIPDTGSTYSLGNSSVAFLTGFFDAISSVNGTLNIQVDETNVITANSTVIDMQAKELINFDAGVNEQSGTSYTLTTSDNGKIITMNNAAAITLTLENSLSAGFTCAVIQKGAGQITFTEEAGANLVNRQSHTQSAGQYAICTLYVDENSGGTSAVYFLGGDTA